MACRCWGPMPRLLQSSRSVHACQFVRSWCLIHEDVTSMVLWFSDSLLVLRCDDCLLSWIAGLCSSGRKRSRKSQSFQRGKPHSVEENATPWGRNDMNLPHSTAWWWKVDTSDEVKRADGHACKVWAWRAHATSGGDMRCAWTKSSCKRDRTPAVPHGLWKDASRKVSSPLFYMAWVALAHVCVAYQWRTA